MSTGTIVAALGLGIVILVLFPIGIKLLLSSFRQLTLAWASTRWPSTQGHVFATSIQEQVNADSETNRRTTYYRPDVHYKYQIGNHNYTSSQRVFGEKPRYDTRDRAQTIIENYPTGRALKVYYDPANPHQAVLEPGKIGTILGNLVGGVICLGLVWLLFRIVITILGVR